MIIQMIMWDYDVYRKTTLNKVFNIIQFVETYKKIQLPISYKYSSEVLEINFLVTNNYNEYQYCNSVTIMDTNIDERIAKLFPLTIREYTQISSDFYTYIMNLHSFKPFFKIDDEILNQIEEYTSFEYKKDKQRLIKKVFMFQKILTLLLNDQESFSICLNLCLINVKKNIENIPSAVKIIHSINRFIKYILSYSNEYQFNELYYDIVIEKVNNVYNNFNIIYKELANEDNKSRIIPIIKGEDYYIGGILLNSTIISKGYKKLVAMYHETVSQFLKLKIKLSPINETFKALIQGFNDKNNGSFIENFKESIENHSINNEDIGKNLNKVFGLFNRCTNIVILLMYLSSGGVLRMFELVDLKVGENNNNLFIHKDSSTNKFHLFIRKRSTNEMISFINGEVTKIFLHYFFTIRLPLSSFFSKLSMKNDTIDFKSLLLKFNENDEFQMKDFDNKCLKTENSYHDSLIFIDNQLFIAIKEKVITKIDIAAIRILFTGIFSDEYNFKLFRQFFTAYLDYFPKDVLLSENHKMMIKWDHLLNKTESNDRTADTNGDIEYYFNKNPIKFTPLQIEKHLKKLNIKLIDQQRSCLYDINGSNHNYILQARTGFGKSFISKIMFDLNVNKLNMLVVPYSISKFDKHEKYPGYFGSFEKIVDDINESCLKKCYLGTYEDFNKIDMNSIEKNLKGIILFDNCHLIAKESSCRKIINEFHQYNFNEFDKILLCSATIKREECYEIFQLLNIKSRMNYNSFVTELPIKNFYLVSKKNLNLSEVLFNFEKSLASRCIVFFKSKEELKNLSLPYHKLHGDLDNEEKTLVLESFYNNEKILLTTKNMSYGINLQNISLVILYDCAFRDHDIIQSIGRIRNQGLVVTTDNFCARKRFEKFYVTNDQTSGHDCCCSKVTNQPFKRIYDTLFKKSSIDISLRVLGDRMNVNSLNIQLNDVNKSNEKLHRIIQDPFFLYCYDELVLNYGDDVEVLADKFYDIFMEKYDDKSLDNFNRLSLQLAQKLINSKDIRYMNRWDKFYRDFDIDLEFPTGMHEIVKKLNHPFNDVLCSNCLRRFCDKQCFFRFTYILYNFWIGRRGYKSVDYKYSMKLYSLYVIVGLQCDKNRLLFFD
mgnify:FL=1